MQAMTTATNAVAPQTAPIRGSLAALSLSIFLASLGTSIANVALPTLTLALDATFQEVQWIVLAYLLSVTTLVVGAGRLGDIVGRRRLLLAGVLLFTTASVVCGLAPSLWTLIAARAVQGAGAAIMMALAMAFVGEIVPKERTGSAMGLLGTMSAIGTALGPSLGGLLISEAGWRAIFFVNLPLGLLTLVLAYRALPADRPRSDRPGFDATGALVLAATLTAYALAMTWGRGSFGAVNAGLVIVAMAGVVLFVVVESKASSPLIRPARLRDPGLSAGLATNALVAAVMMATLVVGPFHLSGALGLDAVMVGLAMSVGPFVTASAGIPAGRMVDRYGAGRAAVVGLGAMAVGAGLLAVLPAAFGIAAYLAPIAVLTSGYALVQAANNTAVMAGVAQDQRGVVSGLLNLSRNLGLVSGASAMGAVFAAAGMQGAFAIATVLVGAALAISLRRK
ncbi:MAG: MFS transporter [Rhodospirillaceae bacterium]|nr:MFS transporter [Rhodospirillaceae bacterium]